MSCRYCNGEWGDDIKEADLLYQEMDDTTVSVHVPEEGSLDDDLGPVLYAEVGIFGHTFTNRYPIRFCPMCGRDLRGGR